MDIVEVIAENRIREAIEREEFNDLSLKGKQIDLSYYFKISQNLRITNDILHKVGVVPEEVTLKKEIDEIKNKLNLARTNSNLKVY